MPSFYSAEKTILGKKETTYGTQVTLSGTTDAVKTRELSVDIINGDTEELKYDNGGIGQGPIRRTTQFVGYNFKTDFAGSGTAGTAPAWGFLAKACGMSETLVATTSATYALNKAPDSLTLAYSNGRNLHPGVGARGNLKLDLSPKKHPFLEFDFTGIYVPPSDAAFPTVNQATWQSPLPVNFANTTTVSLFGYAVSLAACTLDFGNKLTKVNMPGVNYVDLVSRAPSANITILEPGIAAKDFYAIERAGTLGAFSMIHGVGAGKILTLGSAALTQITNLQKVDVDGVAGLSMTLRFCDSDAGVPDFTIVNT